MQIYYELVVARFDSSQQKEYDDLLKARDEDYAFADRHQKLQELEDHLMLSPGVEYWGKVGFKLLVDVRGLLFANKQSYDEMLTTVFNKNAFVVQISEHQSVESAGIFYYPIARTRIAQVQSLKIVIHQDTLLKDSRRAQSCKHIKHNIGHVVHCLGHAGANLRSLSVLFITCYQGSIEQSRRDVDALFENEKAKPVALKRSDGRIDCLDRQNVQAFFTSAFDIADTLCLLKGTSKLEHLTLHGDFPSKVIMQLEKHFGLSVETLEKLADSSTRTQAGVNGIDETTGQSRDTLAAVKWDMAMGDPTNTLLADMAAIAAKRPLWTPAVRAMMMAPPTADQMARARESRRAG